MISQSIKRFLTLYWLLLLVPTLFIGIASYTLLDREKDRLQEQAKETYLERSRVIAETVRITVLSVQEAVTDTLDELQAESLEESLIAWRNSNSLIRNVFIWLPETGLQYPLKEAPSSTEEAFFVERYDAIFSGRLPWSDNEFDQVDAAASIKAQDYIPSSVSKKKYDLVEEVQSLKSSKRKLVGLAKEGSNIQLDSSAIESEMVGCGWKPWFMENQLYMIGWCQQGKQGPIYGVELEVMTLLSRLVSSFPEKAPPGLVYTLIDGNGLVLHQSIGEAIDKGLEMELSVPLAPQLPHWQVGVHVIDDALARQSAREFMILSGMLLAILLCALLAGGALITWQTIRHIKDARQKTTFVSNVSHELKTPLTSIRMYAELLQEGRVNDAAKQKQYLEVIVDESQRLTRLVNNVLDFSRIEQSRKKYHLVQIELPGFLNHFIDAHRVRLEKAGLDIQNHTSNKECTATADRDAIEQVLLNLIDNTVKYAASGKEIQFILDRQEEFCRVQIRDRGPGVPAGQRQKIFEKFHRVDDTLTAQQPGSGLGLSIAQKILRDMHGDLLYEECQGGGSCFVVLLPRIQE